MNKVFERKFLYNRSVRIWLKIGLIMLIGQVIIGGITRLTGSGLSITKWEIVTGTIPPLDQKDWEEAFDLYKETPQFQKINSHFDLNDFKYIFFWEYFHRLWARSLGFVFLIPFLYFVSTKKIDRSLIKRLTVVILLTAITASAGWIMVSSGLVDKPWVNAYKLTLHFMLAVITISAMVWTIANTKLTVDAESGCRNLIKPVLVLTFIQLIVAGMMSGMKAGLYYPTWPDMNGAFIPEVLWDHNNWTWHNLTNYDSYLFAPALIQFLHRLLAYVLLIVTYYLFFNFRKVPEKIEKIWLTRSFVLINLQVLLGIATLFYIRGASIPVFFGVTHQLVGLLFYVSLLFLFFGLKKPKQAK